MNYDTAVILFLFSALGHAVKSLMAIVVFKQVEGLHKASGLVKVFDLFLPDENSTGHAILQKS